MRARCYLASIERALPPPIRTSNLFIDGKVDRLEARTVLLLPAALPDAQQGAAAEPVAQREAAGVAVLAAQQAVVAAVVA